MRTDSATSSAHLSDIIFSSLERLLTGWGNNAVVLSILVLPPIWLINTYYPQGLPFATVSYTAIIFTQGILNLRRNEEYIQARKKGREITEEYSLTLVVSVFLVISVTSISTIIILGAVVGTYVNQLIGPSYAMLAAIFVPAIDNELADVHSLLSPSNLVRYMTLQIIVSLSYLRGGDVGLLMDVSDPRRYRGFSR